MTAPDIAPLASPSGDDAELIAAEREIARLRAESDRLTAAGDDPGDHDELWNPIWALETKIATTPAATLAGAAIKLRRLADPELGIEAGDDGNDLSSLRQALGVVEREAGEPSDAVILSRFKGWIAACDAADAAAKALPDEDPRFLATVDHLNDLAIEIATMPCASAAGLGVKAFLSIWASDAAGRRTCTLRALETKHNSSRIIEGCIRDAVRFVPELAPLCAAIIGEDQP